MATKDDPAPEEEYEYEYEEDQGQGQAPVWGAQGQVPPVDKEVRSGDVHLNAEAQFGEPLYEIKEEQKSCCSSQRVTISLRFFPNVVVYHTETRFCCYPEGYYSVAIPKHKIMGVTLSKLNPGTYLRYGIGLTLLGLMFTIIGAAADVGALLGIGIVILLIGLFVIIYPCFYKKYTIHLTLKHPEEKRTERFRNFFSRLFDANSASDRLIVTTKEEPNRAFILHYVHGVLDKQSDGYHVIGHLENDGLMKAVKLQHTLMTFD